MSHRLCTVGRSVVFLFYPADCPLVQRDRSDEICHSNIQSNNGIFPRVQYMHRRHIYIYPTITASHIDPSPPLPVARPRARASFLPPHLPVHDAEVTLSLLELHVKLSDVVVLPGEAHIQLRDSLLQRSALPLPLHPSRAEAVTTAATASGLTLRPDRDNNHATYGRAAGGERRGVGAMRFVRLSYTFPSLANSRASAARDDRYRCSTTSKREKIKH